MAFMVWLSRFPDFHFSAISRLTFLAFSEMSQQLLDGLPLNFGSDIPGAQRMNPDYFGDPLTSPLAVLISKYSLTELLAWL